MAEKKIGNNYSKSAPQFRERINDIEVWVQFDIAGSEMIEDAQKLFPI